MDQLVLSRRQRVDELQLSSVYLVLNSLQHKGEVMSSLKQKLGIIRRSHFQLLKKRAKEAGENYKRDRSHPRIIFQDFEETCER